MPRSRLNQWKYEVDYYNKLNDDEKKFLEAFEAEQEAKHSDVHAGRRDILNRSMYKTSLVDFDVESPNLNPEEAFLQEEDERFESIILAEFEARKWDARVIKRAAAMVEKARDIYDDMGPKALMSFLEKDRQRWEKEQEKQRAKRAKIVWGGAA
jgi:hypothetical protein